LNHFFINRLVITLQKYIFKIVFNKTIDLDWHYFFQNKRIVKVVYFLII